MLPSVAKCLWLGQHFARPTTALLFGGAALLPDVLAVHRAQVASRRFLVVTQPHGRDSFLGSACDPQRIVCAAPDILTALRQLCVDLCHEARAAAGWVRHRAAIEKWVQHGACRGSAAPVARLIMDYAGQHDERPYLLVVDEWRHDPFCWFETRAQRAAASVLGRKDPLRDCLRALARHAKQLNLTLVLAAETGADVPHQLRPRCVDLVVFGRRAICNETRSTRIYRPFADAAGLTLVAFRQLWNDTTGSWHNGGGPHARFLMLVWGVDGYECLQYRKTT